MYHSALAYKALGDWSEAITRAEQALMIYEAIEDLNAAKVRAHLAAWQAKSGGAAG